MPSELNKTLTFIPLVFYGVGTMVGAGVYSIIGAAAGEAGTYLWISFLAAGVAALLTVLSYAELSSLYHRAGAEYQYLKAAFPRHRIFSFMVGYLIALNCAATAAAVSLAFAGYLNVFVAAPQLLTAFLLLLLCTGINIAGIRQATWVSILLVCVEVGGLLLIIGAGAMADPTTPAPAPGIPLNPGGLFTATALIFFIYLGFEDVANLSEETVNPTRTIPRALLASVAITAALYILVALAVTALIPPGELADSTSPLTTAAQRASPLLGKVIAVSALFATVSTALITLVSISRLLMGMARDGVMPPPLAAILPARKTPWLSALTLFGAACLLLPLGSVKIVGSISSFGVLLVFIAIQVALIRLRFTLPDRTRPFRVPGAIGRVPVLPVIGILITASLLTRFEPIVYLVGLGALGLGLVLYKIFSIRNQARG